MVDLGSFCIFRANESGTEQSSVPLIFTLDTTCTLNESAKLKSVLCAVLTHIDVSCLYPNRIMNYPVHNGISMNTAA